jgi:hypothetical protein
VKLFAASMSSIMVAVMAKPHAGRIEDTSSWV